MTRLAENNFISRFEAKVKELSKIRGKPILVIYYPPYIPQGAGEIRSEDVSYLYNIFKNYTKELEKIDVLLHTTGGDPYSAYRMIQLVHHYTDVETAIVPYYSYSAGTLMCMGTKEIAFGTMASISPLDIHVDKEDGSRIHLISVDAYIDFARRCKKLIKSDGYDTNVESELMVEFVKQVKALEVGDIFRSRTLTAHYADKLLTDYMFGDLPPNHKKEQKNYVINQLVFGFPTHEFEIDYNIAKDLRLHVSKLSTTESNLAESIIDILNVETENGNICRYLGEDLRMPYYQIIDAKV